MITAVIAAYNEEKIIANVIQRTIPFVTQIIVVDDASSDNTAFIAQRCGAEVIRNLENIGQLNSLKEGFRKADGDIIVTLDADGEHNPEEIPRLVEPILGNKADLVLGRREFIPRPSERWIDRLISLKTGKFYDSGTGFRAIRKELALKLELKGKCVCGILLLEALRYGARIEEVPITINNTNRSRKIAWQHLPQFFIVAKQMLIINRLTR